MISNLIASEFIKFHEIPAILIHRSENVDFTIKQTKVPLRYFFIFSIEASHHEMILGLIAFIKLVKSREFFDLIPETSRDP